MNGLLIGLIIPFTGTVLGASFVLFMKHRMLPKLQKALMGFAAGIMTAASVWSLLIPAMEMTGEEGFKMVVPAIAGFLAGIFFLLLLDNMIPHQHVGEEHSEGPLSGLSKTMKMVLAITLHNIPEGMAVGVALSAALEHNVFLSMAGAIALSIGMAVQNIPDGAIVSMPLRMEGNSRQRSFGLGVLSGVVEPVAAIITIMITSVIEPVLPYLLSFAAGAMMYVVVEELIPETQSGKHSNIGTIGFAIGFVIMMLLDVALG